MIRVLKWVGAISFLAVLAGCAGGDVSEAQANDRANQIKEASQRPDQQGTQE